MRGYNLPDNVSANDPDAPWNKEEKEEEKLFVIRNEKDEEDYWSNDWGWVDFDQATRFTEDEKNIFLHIPLNGEWIELKEDL